MYQYRYYILYNYKTYTYNGKSNKKSFYNFNKSSEKSSENKTIFLKNRNYYLKTYKTTKNLYKIKNYNFIFKKLACICLKRRSPSRLSFCTVISTTGRIRSLLMAVDTRKIRNIPVGPIQPALKKRRVLKTTDSLILNFYSRRWLLTLQSLI